MMKGWKEVKLEIVAPYWKGKIEAKELDESNFVSAENMFPEKGGITKSNYVSDKGKATSFKNKDILISNIRPYFKKIWFSDRKGGCSNDVIVFRTNQDIADSTFVYYYLSKDDFFDFMMAGANGTKMPRGNKKSIPQYKITLPPLETQRQIATILSAYDNLIGNNLKRIKLLEEQAQQTYEEWFVRMKFPGHKTAEFDVESGLPLGWKKVRLKEISDFQNGYAYYTKGYSETGYTVIDLGNVSEFGDLNITGKEKFISEELYNELPKFHLKKYDIIIAMTDVTSALRILAKSAIIDKDDTYALNQRVGMLRSNTDLFDFAFLYALLSDPRFIGRMKAMSKGAVQFYFNTKDIVNYETFLPTKKIIDDFIKIYKPILELRMKFKEQNQRLKEARDILLPRLMTGMIDVSKITT